MINSFLVTHHFGDWFGGCWSLGIPEVEDIVVGGGDQTFGDIVVDGCSFDETVFGDFDLFV